MKDTFFLGANSHKGFASLYGSFASGADDMLHIIKGGPGTGKSGFMRRIGEEAEKRGFDVEYVVCSGDPASLDGVYIPALHEGFMDGTAPHTADPEYFGASGDYINIGSFCSLPFSAGEKRRIKHISHEHRLLCRRAYDYLEAAAAVGRAARPELMTVEGRHAIFRRIDDIISDFDSSGRKTHSHRFISAISCEGSVHLAPPCGTYCTIKSSTGFAADVLAYAYKLCSDKALPVIACHSPLEPDRLEAIILPENNIAFAEAEIGIEGELLINCDAYIAANALKAAMPEIKAANSLKNQLISAAESRLREAKTLHDELESIYIPRMDFDGLNKFTEEYINNLFVNYNM